MRTTIDLPDEVFREANVTAAMQGIKLKELFLDLIQSGLRAKKRADQAKPPERTPLPIFRKASGRGKIPALTNA